MHGWEAIMDSYTISISQEDSKVTFFFLCKTFSWNNNVRQRTGNSKILCTSLPLSFKRTLKNFSFFPKSLGSLWRMNLTSQCSIKNCFPTAWVGLMRLVLQNSALYVCSAHPHCCNIRRHDDEEVRCIWNISSCLFDS